MRSVPRLVALGVLAVAACAPLRPRTVVPGTPPLHYTVVGSGPALVVVLHGGPGLTHDYLRPEWDRLAAVGQVVYYDQRGCGANPADGPITWQDHVADLDRLIRGLRRGRKVFLAGSSWGSELALRYAWVHPEGVAALVLSGFVGWPDSAATVQALTMDEPASARSLGPLGLLRGERPQRRGGDSAATSFRIDSALLRPVASDSLAPLTPAATPRSSRFGPATPHDSAAFAAAVEDAVRRTIQRYGRVTLRREADTVRGTPRVYALDPGAVGGDSALAWRAPMECHEAGLRTGLSRLGPPLAALASIRVPTLVVSGGSGIMPDNARQLVGVLPNLIVRPLAGGGHDPWYTQADAFFGLAIGFLRDQLARPAPLR